MCASYTPHLVGLAIVKQQGRRSLIADGQQRLTWVTH
jgi:hypothetical protein